MTVAIKPTIYKCRIDLSDLNRNYYDNLNLTIAKHPSETLERMMVRVMAFCINAQEGLVFSRGISSPEEPDIWIRDTTDSIALWIDVGEPAVDRIKKASHIARQIKIYSFNTKSPVWWAQNQAGLTTLKNLTVTQFHWEEITNLSTLVERTMEFSVTMTGDCAYVAFAQGACELNWKYIMD